MLLPTQEEQTNYLRAQKTQILDKQFNDELEMAFNEAWMKQTKDSELKRDARDAIKKYKNSLDGSKSYLKVLNEFLKEEDTDLSDDKKKTIVDSRIQEIKKANFRGVVAKKLFELRKGKADNEDIEDKYDDELEGADNSMEMNGVFYNVLCKVLEDLRG